MSFLLKTPLFPHLLLILRVIIISKGGDYMIRKSDILKASLDLSAQIVTAKASADSNSVTPETLPEYTEVIYKKLIELMDEED